MMSEQTVKKSSGKNSGRKKRKNSRKKRMVYAAGGLALGLIVGAGAGTYMGKRSAAEQIESLTRQEAALQEEVRTKEEELMQAQANEQAQIEAREQAEARVSELEQQLGDDGEAGSDEDSEEDSEDDAGEDTSDDTDEDSSKDVPEDQNLNWNDDWKYASNSKIHSTYVTLYRSHASSRKGKVIAVNAGHGTSGGSNVKTLCHPDGSAKVTGGSTAAGATTATAVSGGTTLLDGSSEASVNLALAKIVKQELLDAGYDVLMIRESSDCQLDNIARTVFANQYADCHIALHYDSTENDKGLFYIGVPNVSSYRSMEPVASHYQQHEALGQALLAGMKSAGVKIYGSGTMAVDLTQTSYSTIPSVDLEVGDRGSGHSESVHKSLAAGIVNGVNNYFGN